MEFTNKKRNEKKNTKNFFVLSNYFLEIKQKKEEAINKDQRLTKKRTNIEKKRSRQ